MREVGLDVQRRRPRSSGWTASARTSSRTLSVVMCARRLLERGADAVALGGGDAGDLRRRGPRRSSSRAATPSRRRRARPARRARGRSAARGCGSSPPLPRASTPRGEVPAYATARGRRCRRRRRPSSAAGRPRAARSRRNVSAVGVVAHPGDALAVAGVGGGLGDEQAGDAGVVLGGLARGIDVEDDRRGRRRASALPNAVASRWVRLYRCGWKSATTRRGSGVRAASIVAATSVGWWA